MLPIRLTITTAKPAIRFVLIIDRALASAFATYRFAAKSCFSYLAQVTPIADFYQFLDALLGVAESSEFNSPSMRTFMRLSKPDFEQYGDVSPMKGEPMLTRQRFCTKL